LTHTRYTRARDEWYNKTMNHHFNDSYQ